VIRVSNVSKVYQIWHTPLSRLLVPFAFRFLRPFFPDWYESLYRRNCQSVHALQDISFELNRGSSLGIIGLNGSGKSTLLQIVAGTLRPTTGEVVIEGRVAALLELGSGFDPEFTGRENVLVNATILGLTRQELLERYDAIVAFADIGPFIDQPVKTYSSGMVMRLAFAVQVHVDPEVLVVDEALSVGDARFQARALTRIEAILRAGTTLLFVGHDLNVVKAFCDQALLLDGGRIVERGLPEDVIAHYLAHQATSGEPREITGAGFTQSGFGIRRAAITGYGDHAQLAFDDVLNLEIDMELTSAPEHPFLIIDIVDQKGLQLTGRRVAIPHEAGGLKQLRVSVACTFQQGIYRIRMRLVDAPSIELTRLIGRYEGLLSFEMVTDVRDRFTGLFPVPISTEWQ
jgi:lipopolysaccharide transport system ATP-binding protein